MILANNETKIKNTDRVSSLLRENVFLLKELTTEIEFDRISKQTLKERIREISENLKLAKKIS